MLEVLLIAGLGSLTQEILHWYELRQKLSTKRVRKLISSRGYWIITILVILISPICCWVLIGEDEVSRQIQFLSGAGFPLIFKKSVSAIAKNDETPLGDSDIRDYFLLYGTRD